MKNIKIIVSRFGSDGKEQVLYQVSIEVPDSLEFPFAQVENVMRLLYPCSDMVSFKVI